MGSSSQLTERRQGQGVFPPGPNDLSQYVVEICSLQDSKGKIYKPVEWKGSPLGGHHRRGILEFPKLEGNPQSVKLVIRGIADVPERSFEWKVGS
jgi:hypothetical protein